MRAIVHQPSTFLRLTTRFLWFVTRFPHPARPSATRAHRHHASPLLVSVPYVVELGAEEQVRGLDAAGKVARVEHVLSPGDRAEGEPPREPVSGDVRAARNRAEPPVAVSIVVRDPRKAAALEPASPAL